MASWTAAADIQDDSPCREASRGSTPDRPRSRTVPALAMALARQGQFRDAWTRWETGLARGLLDDLSARSPGP